MPIAPDKRIDSVNPESNSKSNRKRTVILVRILIAPPQRLNRSIQVIQIQLTHIDVTSQKLTSHTRG